MMLAYMYTYKHTPNNYIHLNIHTCLAYVYSLYISTLYHTYVYNLYTYPMWLPFQCDHHSILEDYFHSQNFENHCDTDQVW